jgi:Rieske Fe-S protein
MVDLINHQSNPYHSIVDSCRWDVVGTGGGMVKEGYHTAKHLIGDKIKQHLSNKTIQDLSADEGGIVKADGKLVGAYRDKNGKYHVVNPVCSHLGCNVLWNQTEKKYLCPCHGSSFAYDGAVLHGPAVNNLPKIQDLQW